MLRKFTILPVALIAAALGWLAPAGPSLLSGMPGSAAYASEVVEMTLGDENAPVTMIEYASFTCPHCANFHEEVFPDLKADYIDTGKLRFVYREVYFDRPGLWAGMVARCGGEERYFGVVDMLYERQRDWVGDGEATTIAQNLRKIGRASGLGDDKLDACMSDVDMARAMLEVYETNAKADNINATPSFVIDGKLYSNMSYDEMREVLDAKLAE